MPAPAVALAKEGGYLGAGYWVLGAGYWVPAPAVALAKEGGYWVLGTGRI